MHKFFKAVAFVTIFSVLTRAIGFFLRIYLSRVMGTEVLGAYQVAMSIFGVLMTVISSGIPLVVSRNVAYFDAQNNKKSQHQNITAGLIISVLIAIVICVILTAFPEILKLFMQSQESVNIILYLLPALIASAVYAILRGGLWGKKCFFTISFSEFFEQVVRIVFCVILFESSMSLSVGEKSALSLTISCIISAVFVFVMYFVFGGRFSSPKAAILPVLKTSTPITIVRTISSVVGSLIAIIIPVQLMKYGYSNSEALSVFGIFMGMTMPVLMIPNTFIGSFAVALVPEVSAFTNNIDKTGVKDKNGLSLQVSTAIKTAIVISFMAMPAFIALGEPICQFLFGNAQAGKFLSLCAIMMLPMGLGQICSSMLNAIGLEMKALISYAVGAIALFLCIILLPKYMGEYAMMLGLGLMHSITSLLSLRMLNKRKIIDWSFLKTVAACLLICVPTTILGRLVYSVINKFSGLFVSLAVSGFLTVIFTILLMIVFNVTSLKVIVSKVVKRKKGKTRLLPLQNK